MVQIKSNYVFEIVCALISLFSLAIVLLCLLSLSDHDQDRWRGDFIDKRCGCLEHADLNINASCFLNIATFLVKLSSFRPTLDAFAYSCNFNDQVFVVEFICNLHSTVHISHFYCGTSDTGIALSVVLLQVNFIVKNFARWVDVSPLI